MLGLGIDLTHRCNLHCKFCWKFVENSEYEMSMEQVEAIFPYEVNNAKSFFSLLVEYVADLVVIKIAPLLAIDPYLFVATNDFKTVILAILFGSIKFVF